MSSVNPINDPSSLDNPLVKERLLEEQLQEVEALNENLQTNVSQGVEEEAKNAEQVQQNAVKPESSTDASRRTCPQHPI